MASKFPFPKKVRLLRSADFDAVFRHQMFAADDVLVMQAKPNGLAYNRLGLSVSKKAGNAVVRNAWKRRIREAFRLQQHELPTGLDLVVRPRKGAECSYQKVEKSLANLIHRVAKKV